MPKRKRSSSHPTSCWVTVHKKRRKTRSPSLSAVGDDVRESSLSLKSSSKGRRPSIPKSASKLLPDINDQLLFLDLMSRCKRPRSKMEWRLMAQCFIPKGSLSNNAITGRTLHDFYGILVQNDCIEDDQFEPKWSSLEEGVVDLDIDFASNRYQTARCKFPAKSKGSISHTQTHQTHKHNRFFACKTC